MTKATGRGRGWRKKAWTDLAPSTRKRYEQAGIDAGRHARGDRKDTISKWLQHQEDVYGWEDNGDGTYTISVNGSERTDSLPSNRQELLDLIHDQKQAEFAYTHGNEGAASRMWTQRSANAPEWMYFYHGVFGFLARVHYVEVWRLG